MPPPTQKINKDLYFDKRTGDVFEYKHGDTRADNQKGVRQTLARIRALINCNVVNPSFCRWLTFTYAENMTDTNAFTKTGIHSANASADGAHRTALTSRSISRLSNHRGAVHGICTFFHLATSCTISG